MSERWRDEGFSLVNHLYVNVPESSRWAVVEYVGRRVKPVHTSQSDWDEHLMNSAIDKYDEWREDGKSPSHSLALTYAGLFVSMMQMYEDRHGTFSSLEEFPSWFMVYGDDV